MISKLVYLYHKKNRYLQSYIQDLIADKTYFEPHKIKLEISSKELKKFIEEAIGYGYIMVKREKWTTRKQKRWQVNFTWKSIKNWN